MTSTWLLKIINPQQKWMSQYQFIPSQWDIENFDTVRKSNVYSTIPAARKIFILQKACLTANQIITRLLKHD